MEKSNNVKYRLSVLNLTDLNVKISKGNGKIGKIFNVSTLPGDASHKPSTKKDGILTDVAGTCGGVCTDCHQFCYAFDSARQYHSSCIPAWGGNTRILREDPERFFDEIDHELTKRNHSKNKNVKKVEEFRINVSGELEHPSQLKSWVELAKKHPETRFGIYTKRFSWVLEYLVQNTKFPENFYLNASEWNHNLDPFMEQLEGKVNIFAYADTLQEALTFKKKGYKMCRAINYKGQHTGVLCDECGYCYGKEGICKVFVLDHSSAGRGRLGIEARKLEKEGRLQAVISELTPDPVL